MRGTGTGDELSKAVIDQIIRDLPGPEAFGFALAVTGKYWCLWGRRMTQSSVYAKRISLAPCGARMWNGKHKSRETS